jgi:hypothetical protein
MKPVDNNALDELKKIEGEDDIHQNDEQEEPKVKPFSKKEILNQEPPNIVDGWKTLSDDELPNGGVLYPRSWKFAYRSPQTKEVANFSTVQENDTPAIIAAIEDLIRKCVKIYDTDLNREVSSSEVNDAHKLFFALKIREFYMPANPIKYMGICDICHENFDAQLIASSLEYNDIKPKLIHDFDGRIFSLNMGLEDNINFHIPTIGIMSRLFKYIVKVHRDANPNDREKKDDKVVYDKVFLLLAPYLFETGKETIKEIIKKYQTVIKNDKLYETYLKIANNLKLDNAETIEQICPFCGAEVTVQVSFPGGWKAFFNKPVDDFEYM